MHSVRRKLAAIMFIDIVGYSARSHDDESLALTLLEEHRTLTRPILTQCNGTEIKTIGDAFLVEFDSALDAVTCAIEIQKEHELRNSEVPPERRVDLRIGIHLGDIVRSENDVYGDGVNIAARIQNLAPAGGICISQAIYDQVYNKVHCPIVKVGTRHLRGIRHLMAIYLVERKGTAPANTQLLRARLQQWFQPSPLVAAIFGIVLAAGVGSLNPGRSMPPSLANTKPSTKINPTLGHPRIAVLPFRSINLNHEDSYLSDGLTEELISSLSRTNVVRVLARATVAQYRVERKSPAQIGQELQVGMLVEGNVRSIGGTLRVNVQLINTATEENIWSRDFDGKVNEAFEIQKRIAAQVAATIKGRSVASVEAPNMNLGDSPNGEAYLFLLKARHLMNRRTEDSLRRAEEYLEKALKEDPRFPAAHAAMANVYGLLSFYGLLSPSGAMEKKMPHVARALKMDPGSAEALMALAEKQAYYDFDFVSAERSFLQAIQLNPNLSTAYQWYATFLAAAQRPEEAVREARKALELDPLSTVTNSALGHILYLNHDLQKAERQFQITLELDPNAVVPRHWLGKVYIRQGKFKEAISQLQLATQLAENFPLSTTGLIQAHAASGNMEKARQQLDMLLHSTRNKYLSAYDLAATYLAMKDKEACLKYLEKALADRNEQLMYVKVDPAFDSIRNDPAMKAFLNKLP